MSEKSAAPRCWRIAHSEASTGWGGQEHRVLAELTGFQNRGSQVWLFAPAESKIRTRALDARIAVELFPAGKLRFPFAVMRTAGWLRRNRIEVLNPHSSRDGWLMGLAGRLAGVPFIVRTRHFDVPTPNRWLSGVVYRQLADHVLTTSPKITDHFREYFQLPDDRVTTLPTGVDTELFSPRGERAELVPMAQLRGLPLIGMVTVIRQAKGHVVLLRAMRRLLDAGLEMHCVFVGDGPLEAIQRVAKELHLEDHLTLTGHREDIPAVLRALDVLAIPSLHEGIPQIGLQALATGTPVVGSNVGGIPSIILPGETGRLVAAGDAGALADAIRETLIDSVATKAMTERGRALVEQKHSLSGMLDQLEILYRRYLPASA